MPKRPKRHRLPSYDPAAVAVDNGNFLGFPAVEWPGVQFIAAPVELTTSYGTGTNGGPANILAESRQLDVMLPGVDRPWEIGFSWHDPLAEETDYLGLLRKKTSALIQRQEEGKSLKKSDWAIIEEVNTTSRRIGKLIEEATARVLAHDSIPAIIGGEHSVPLGAYKAAAKEGSFGILQIDAHMDLRDSYEGFAQSHASIMHNALRLPEISHLVQVGIRDYAPSEVALAREQKDRVTVFYDADLSRHRMRGGSFSEIADRIFEALPERIWVSFDIDGLRPALCPNTGTPVPGGLDWDEACYLIDGLHEAGKVIVGFDLVETAGAPHSFDANVAARLAYRLAVRAWQSRTSIQMDATEEEDAFYSR